MPYATNEQKAARNKLYYAANKDKHAKNNERAAKWYEDNKEHKLLYAHNKHYQIQNYNQIADIFRKILL